VSRSRQGIKELFYRVEIMRHDSLDELACAGDRHWRNLTPANTTFKLARANEREADAGTRTPDPIITSDVLYQLSYVGGSEKNRSVDHGEA
jgi:hypothetical protein